MMSIAADCTAVSSASSSAERADARASSSRIWSSCQNPPLLNPPFSLIPLTVPAGRVPTRLPRMAACGNSDPSVYPKDFRALTRSASKDAAAFAFASALRRSSFALNAWNSAKALASTSTFADSDALDLLGVFFDIDLHLHGRINPASEGEPHSGAPQFSSPWLDCLEKPSLGVSRFGAMVFCRSPLCTLLGAVAKDGSGDSSPQVDPYCAGSVSTGWALRRPHHIAVRGMWLLSHPPRSVRRVSEYGSEDPSFSPHARPGPP